MKRPMRSNKGHRNLAAFMLVISACSPACAKANASPALTCTSSAEKTATARAPVEAYALVDLPNASGVHELSGTSFDPKTRTLYAIEDKAPTIVSLVASPDYRSWSVGEQLPLSGYLGNAWDGEALVRLADGSFDAVANESEPVLAHFDARGAFVRTINVPSDYDGKQVSNKGLESLTLSPDARFMFSANEAALIPDGPRASKTRGTIVRIWRRDLTTSKDEEFAYRTEPLGDGIGGDMGVSELAALSRDELLVLERGYQPGYGNTARIFHIHLTGAKDISKIALEGDATPTLQKTLVVDVATLHCPGVTHPGAQPNPILENYEAMTVGPTLPDGRHLLFLTSDDNARADQVTRILVLALASL